MLIFTMMLTLLVVGLTLVMHRLARRRTKTFVRFAYYVPGALAGASSVLLWLFLLDPTVSPIAWLLNATGAGAFFAASRPLSGCRSSSLSSRSGPVRVGGSSSSTALSNAIPTEVIEAAKVDGCGPVRTALQIELPMIRKSVVYMLVLSLAAGTQLFVEPQLVFFPRQVWDRAHRLQREPACLSLRLCPERFQRLCRPVDHVARGRCPTVRALGRPAANSETD